MKISYKWSYLREIKINGVLLFWDAILAHDATENMVGRSLEGVYNNFNMMDYICVGMISYIREERILNNKLVLMKDQNECFQKLFKYPNINNPIVIIRLANQIKGNNYYYKIVRYFSKKVKKRHW